MNGKLYWITGLAGAGKTTIGNALYYELKSQKDNVLLLDGDILKKIVGSDLGYSYEERLERAKRYSNLCKVLTEQGIDVVICTIAMFDSIREWNRENIPGYIEIFLDVEKEVLIKRDRKGLYSKYKNGKTKQLAGVDLEIEFPKNPDLILNNDGSISIRKCVEKIIDISSSCTPDYRRDAEYWNQYYTKKSLGLDKPSKFAMDMFQYMEQGKSILDLGCGNGRDSVFFAEKGLRVTGIDAADEAIKRLNQEYGTKENAIFICDDFVTSRALFQQQYDYCYSRFTLHAIDIRQETELLTNVHDALKDDGKFFIEVRSIHDDIYAMGKQIGKNEYLYNDHYRRFQVKEELEKHLLEKGFEIEFSIEGRDFAPSENSNPVLIRVIAKKKQERN